MKSVLISIQPKWCELIANGKKTIEVRKTKPEIETPFKVYIYCTKPRHFYKISKHLLTSDEGLFLVNGKVKMCDGFGVEYEDCNYKHLNNKVIGEFVCDDIDTIAVLNDLLYCVKNSQANKLKQMCLTIEEIKAYLGEKNEGYNWHISDLVIYDKPKELSGFYKECKKTECEDCPHLQFENTPNSYEGWCIYDEKIPLTRPPQSWCYVVKGGAE
jgi:predicted transcriptional regulator